jgi:ribonuclease HI
MTGKGDRQSASPPSFLLIFDGGSKGNPGPSYGSYVVRGPNGKGKKPTRLRFGRGTNNEAEYRTLIAGIEMILRQMQELGIDPGEVKLEVRGDSKLVLNQVSGRWKAKNARMRALRDQAMNLLEPFGSIEYCHQPRSKSVAVLGH